MSDDGPESEAEITAQAERDQHELQRERGVLELAKLVRKRVDRLAQSDDDLPPAA